MSTPFVLAVPSKGRLQENASAFFARAGLRLVQGRGARDYRGTLEGIDGVEVAFVSASEIVGLLAAGNAHMGVTGEDLVRETVEGADRKLELLTPLGFGNANVVVAVPQAWIDCPHHGRSRRRRRGLLHQARQAHAGGDQIRQSDAALLRRDPRRRLFDRGKPRRHRGRAPRPARRSSSSTSRPTGATLAANGLKVLDDGVILRSEANLVASLGARWDEETREQARQILGRITAEEAARLTRDVVAQFGDARAEARAGLVEEAGRRFGATLRSQNVAGRLTLTCLRDKVAPLADWLVARGARARDGGGDGLRVLAREPVAREAAAKAGLTIVLRAGTFLYETSSGRLAEGAAQGALLILDATTARDTETDRQADDVEPVREEKPHGRLAKRVLDAVIPDHVEDKHAARRKILRWLGLGSASPSRRSPCSC